LTLQPEMLVSVFLTVLRT